MELVEAARESKLEEGARHNQKTKSIPSTFTVIAQGGRLSFAFSRQRYAMLSPRIGHLGFVDSQFDRESSELRKADSSQVLRDSRDGH